MKSLSRPALRRSRDIAMRWLIKLSYGPSAQSGVAKTSDAYLAWYITTAEEGVAAAWDAEGGKP